MKLVKQHKIEKTKILQIRSSSFLLSLPGFEPGAFRLGGEPSILLRYRDIFNTVFILYAFYLFVKEQDEIRQISTDKI